MLAPSAGLTLTAFAQPFAQPPATGLLSSPAVPARPAVPQLVSDPMQFTYIKREDARSVAAGESVVAPAQNDFYVRILRTLGVLTESLLSPDQPTPFGGGGGHGRGDSAQGGSTAGSEQVAVHRAIDLLIKGMISCPPGFGKAGPAEEGRRHAELLGSQDHEGFNLLHCTAALGLANATWLLVRQGRLSHTWTVSPNTTCPDHLGLWWC